MIADDREQELLAELAQTRSELDMLRASKDGSNMQYLEAQSANPATTALSAEPSDNPAVAVLEQIYRDMIAALQQMYRDTIAAKDDALAGRDRELETKDALIEHLRRRAEEAEARSSQALRYIGELDQIEAQASARRTASNEVRRPGFFQRLFGQT
ncbi:MAG TPA: hypothetical protein VF221_12535 [Chloroflexota bacterium]